MNTVNTVNTMNNSAYEFDTLAIHAGQPNDEGNGSVIYPIYQTSTYEQHAPGVPKGFAYSRTENPTRRAFEQCVAALEGAQHGIAFASGLAAVNAILATLRAGDHVVTGKAIYGGVYRMFTKVYSKFGLDVTFVDSTDVEAIAQAITRKTKLLWLETPSNPLLAISDIARAAACAKGMDADVRVVVDNTFATPYLQRPLALGADVVLHSTTKYMNGHGDVISGVLLTDDTAFAEQLRFMQNTLGGVPGPQDCFLVMRGLKTLGLRMDRHCSNAQRVATYLTGHQKVARVHYPGFASHPHHEVAKAQMRQFGGMVSFELEADDAGLRQFATGTKVITLAESLGAVKTLLCHPASMTHASVEPEVRRKHGIPDGLIRLSVGLESVDDLIGDLDQALAALPVR